MQSEEVVTPPGGGKKEKESMGWLTKWLMKRQKKVKKNKWGRRERAA